MPTAVTPWLGYLWKRLTAKRTERWARSGDRPAQWGDPVIQQISLVAQRPFDLYEEVDLRVEIEPTDHATIILTCAVSDKRLGTADAHGKPMTGAQRLNEIRKLLDQPLPPVPSRVRPSRWRNELPTTS